MLGTPASTPTSVVMLLIERRTSSKVLKPPPHESHSDRNSAICLVCTSYVPTAHTVHFPSHTENLSASDRGDAHLEMERTPRLRVPTIAIEPSSSQKQRSDVQSYSTPPWMLKAIVVQLLHHRLRFLWPPTHLTTASATAAMRLKSRTCKVASQYRKRCRGFVRQRILLQRPLIAWVSSAFLVCLRRSRLSSVKALTSWPFGRKIKGGRPTVAARESS